MAQGLLRAYGDGLAAMGLPAVRYVQQGRCGMSNELVLVLDGERPASENVFWSGGHWRERREFAARAHLVVRAALGGEPARITRCVDIEIVAYFDKYPLDSDNICGKPYVDGLVRAGLLVNDTR